METTKTCLGKSGNKLRRITMLYGQLVNNQYLLISTEEKLTNKMEINITDKTGEYGKLEIGNLVAYCKPRHTPEIIKVVGLNKNHVLNEDRIFPRVQVYPISFHSEEAKIEFFSPITVVWTLKKLLNGERLTRPEWNNNYIYLRDGGIKWVTEKTEGMYMGHLNYFDFTILDLSILGGE